MLGLLLLGTMLTTRLAISAEKPGLTAEDHAWLAAHPVIRVGYDPDFKPFCFRDNSGHFAGIDAEMLTYIAAQLGVRFEYVTGSNWTEVYRRAERGEVDMLTSTAITPERERSFLFTRDYIKFPVTIVTRADGPFAVTLTDLKAMKVAAVNHYAPTEMLKRDFPELELRPAATMDEALLMVSRGDADAAVTNLVNASYVIKTRGFANLKIAGVISQTYETRFAVRRDWPEWQSLLERTLTAMPPQETVRILDPWIRVDYASVIRWDVVRRWATIGCIFAITVIGLVTWRNASLRRELTKRRAVQQELEATNGRLQTVNAELTARHEEKTHLLQVAAHDLRNPLTGIVLTIGALQSESPSQVAQSKLDRLERSARQMTRLIDDLLEVDALESGRRQLEIRAVEVMSAVTETADAYQAAAAHKRITLSTRADGSLPIVAADGQGLRQILDNLLSNALKFSPSGACVDVTIRVVEAGVRIEVKDQGPGVFEAERERIFAKFARGSARPTDGEKSTGLGLAIVRELVTGMNGRVWCEPAPERGAVFIVLLPLHRG
jgi:two-component system, NarL family, sensor histidine kinase EvgS